MENPDNLAHGQKKNHFRNKYYVWTAYQDLYFIYPSIFTYIMIVNIYMKLVTMYYEHCMHYLISLLKIILCGKRYY